MHITRILPSYENRLPRLRCEPLSVNAADKAKTDWLISFFNHHFPELIFSHLSLDRRFISRDFEKHSDFFVNLITWLTTALTYEVRSRASLRSLPLVCVSRSTCNLRSELMPRPTNRRTDPFMEIESSKKADVR